MRKFWLFIFTVAVVAFMAQAVTYMRVEQVDGTEVKFDVERVSKVTYVEEEDTPSVKDTVESPLEGELTYEVSFYAVTFHDTTLIDVQKVKNGMPAVEVKVPGYKGYEFVGWSDSSFVEVTSDMNVYAQYTFPETVMDTIEYGVDVDGKIGDYTYVDLGLPSGTKWATCNVGASKPTEYGGHFAWGETEEKTKYTADTYKWWGKNGGKNSFTKYCYEDKKFLLDEEDDAASVHWGGPWRMPTYYDLWELYEGCDWKRMDDFDGTGTVGWLGTSKSNGSVIFLPAGGCIGEWTDSTLYGVGNDGRYWTSSASPAYGYDESYAGGFALSFWDDVFTCNVRERYEGLNVRAVVGKEKIAKVYRVEYVALNKIVKESILVGEGKTVDIGGVEAPEYACYDFVGWEDSSFTSIKSDVRFVAQYVEKSFSERDVTVSGKVGEYTYVDLGLPSGTKWATYNIGASNPLEYGDRFAWGEIEPYVSSRKYQGPYETYAKLPKSVLMACDDAAFVNWGEEWRMPTAEDMRELVDNCCREWVSNYKGSGISGYLFVSAQNDNVIFMPTTIRCGDYWMSTLNGNSRYPEFMSFAVRSSTGFNTCMTGHKYDEGLLIRPVVRQSPVDGSEKEEGRLPGRFSVSDSVRISFSQGNLQYQISSGVWRFAENQYDVIGNTSKDSIDLFLWGASGYKGRYPFLGDRQYEFEGEVAGTDYDWGMYNVISNGGNVAGLWRTLTYDEWNYLLEKRPDAKNLHSRGVVNGVNGYILLPDEWLLPKGLSFAARAAVFGTNEYTKEQWIEMESKGAVFLPCAGFRPLSDPDYRVDSKGVGRIGVYWSSTRYDGFMAHAFVFDSSESGFLEYTDSNGYPLSGFYNGSSVRLVAE